VREEERRGGGEKRGWPDCGVVVPESNSPKLQMQSSSGGKKAGAAVLEEHKTVGWSAFMAEQRSAARRCWLGFDTQGSMHPGLRS